MRTAIVTGLLLAVCGLAQDYPKPNGFVNDFANQLPLEAVQSLEMKVRCHSKAHVSDRFWWLIQQAPLQSSLRECRDGPPSSPYA